ncbi:type II toxin-antitoxin system HicA family toxin [Candidatus Chloroploca sp. M-50]|uniref:Type II toxin-antitoxin system HicA family toxin n=1 Tax=Candidatus Chloroploca mongolica TaxID=2528176 RepID=A0ABS4D4C4_9CHLR|nr:type II toxin-antitoxin system HicA family toxin [Candidatus Chloroploca mongolica]MBP1464280.1 type II toxin-antitoxin system HicA family toxin [Candidatus Chloroploca mongolica]
MSSWSATKARRVLAALLRIGWHIKRTSGSHRTMVRPNYFMGRFPPIELSSAIRSLSMICSSSCSHGCMTMCLLKTVPLGSLTAWRLSNSVTATNTII